MESIKNISLRKESLGIIGVLFISVLMPVIYHMVGMKGTVFLPIFLGVIAATYFLTLPSVIAIALLSPVINHILTGMPPVSPYPVMQQIIFEGVVIGTTAHLIKGRVNTFMRATIPILTGRLSVLLLLMVFPSLSLSFISEALIAGIPGMSLNLTASIMIYVWIKEKQ